jgi:3'-phosphoadenosine 5'-phosphosulfate sulfotransferase (PAPS reductase)/FAD synthetase
MKDFFKPDIPANAIYHVGVSGGKDSGAVLLWMVHESGIPRHQINATFCDTGNEHEWTYEQVERLSKWVHPIETLKPKLDFYALAQKKKRFPSACARFCTQELKIHPSQDHIRYLQQAYSHVVAVSGVRSNESFERAKLLEWDYSGNLLTVQWRPLITWKIEDVIAIHQKYGIAMNRLYATGAKRVGCFPCVMSNKAEIRNIAQNFPERIAIIESAEKATRDAGNYGAFFARDKVPMRFRTEEIVTKDGEKMMTCNIGDVVRWSMTGKRAKGSYLDDEPEPVSCSSGFCE